MLSACTHQAAGLLTLNERQSPRILSVVQHGDELAELPFLWRLCLACTTLGFTVTVLDATIGESESTPGLLQRLQQETTPPAPTNSWTVLPSKEGLAQLSFAGTNHQRGWHQLTHCFSDTGVVILYCNAECAANTLKGLLVPTLLPVSQQRASLLTSYLALKRLLIVGGQQPTIISVQGPGTDNGKASLPPVCSSLVECARNFLNFEARVIAFTDTADDENAVDFLPFLRGLLEACAQQVSSSSLATHALFPSTALDGPTPLNMRVLDVHR